MSTVRSPHNFRLGSDTTSIFADVMVSTHALQDSNLRSGVVTTTRSVPSVGMGWVIVDFGMAIPKVGMTPGMNEKASQTATKGIKNCPPPTFGMAIPKTTITQPIPTLGTDRVVGTTPERRLDLESTVLTLVVCRAHHLYHVSLGSNVLMYLVR